ncbi:hypothetical protein [Nakamurella leprariae]|uniref:Uncharacterized protein n=1 Tax=Nakamurella leprariae TaxID=2803911 RepID=A0A938Y647_9ACTN|nr:hypothetical protein [Nakamurella leprariae]MBM9466741.1 hypothetical protein [Nakamurella leprariae]
MRRLAALLLAIVAATASIGLVVAPVAAAASPARGALDSAVRVPNVTQAIITGWALDPNAPGAATEVHIYVNGAGHVRRAAEPRPDVNAALGVPGDHGFAATVPIGYGTNEVCVFAISATGAGNTLLRCQFVSGGRYDPAQGALDSVTVSPDGKAVTVAGWSRLPPLPRSTAPVHIYINGVGYERPAREPRPDVNAAFGVPGNYGFEHTLPLDPGSNEVCVFAISTVGSGNTLLGCRTVEGAASLLPAVGALDGVARSSDGTVATVSGWALDPNAPGESTDVDISVNGEWFTGEAADPRPDVNAVLGVRGDHGFAYDVPLRAGSNEVCAVAVSRSGGDDTALGCRTVHGPGSAPAQGVLDAAIRSVDGASVTVTGWTLDPNAPEAGTDVHIYVNGVGHARTAGQPRPDVNAVLGVPGDHGFHVTVPIDLRTAQVCVLAISTTGQANTVIGCREV